MKVIVSDLDGTLLDEFGEISQKNADTINKVINNGIQFIAATGRSYEAAYKPLRDAGVKCPIIAQNGAAIYSEEGTLLEDKPMNISKCKEIASLCEKENIYIEFCTNKGNYSKDRQAFVDLMIQVVRNSNPHMTEEEVLKRAQSRLQEDQVKHVDDFSELYDVCDLKVYKILGFSLLPNKLDELHEKFHRESNLAISSSSNINIEFNHVNAQKGLAIESWASKIGVELRDVVVLGDSFNDVSMLKIAGHSIAMENAPDEIKELCDYITLSNSQDGVSFAIERLLKEL